MDHHGSPITSGPSTFHEFIRRVRTGDEEAAAQLVRCYEPAIRCEVRLRLTDPRLGRLLDSLDVCQEVLASFFVRAAAGQYDLDRPEDLLRLLLRMARNKLVTQTRRQQARAVDRRRVEVKDLEQVAVRGPDPGRQAADRELLERVRGCLGPEEQQVAALRAEGHSWAEVAAALGGTPEGRRKQMSRALDRVAEELGLDEGDAESL